MAIGHERIGQYVEAKKLARRLFERPLSRWAPFAVLAVGLALGAGSLVRYDRSGYSHGMLWVWFASLALLGVFFGTRSKALPRVAWLDLAIPPALALFLSPLYLLELYRWPVQVSSDEIGVMTASQNYASMPNVDPFGVIPYRAFPALLFVVWGKTGNLLGGIELVHMRFLQAAVGLFVIAASYALFRQVLPRGWSICASLVFGFSHSYLMISRLAMRENTAVLMEVVALALLLWGLRRNHELATFAGGIVAGLGFYVYAPSRATFPIWILFLIGLAIFYRRMFPVRRLVTLGLVASVGLVLMAGPVTIAEKNAPHWLTAPNREAILIYRESRLQQRDWVHAKDEWSGYLTNVRNGLGTFNANVVDNSWIYANWGHGFVDPLTGFLLWIGVGVVGVALIRRRAGPESLLFLAGFLVLWLSFAFLVNKAPNYTRLLVTLPFVAFLVTEAVRWLAGRWRPIPHAATVVAVGLVSAVAVWNLNIAWDFIQRGRRDGEQIGSTGRYVTDHAGIPGIQFYMSTDEGGTYSYYDWGNISATQDRIGLFAANRGQIGSLVNPYELRNFVAHAPFALFMRRTLWQTAAIDLANRYPHGRLRNVTPGGKLVVLEVFRT